MYCPKCGNLQVQEELRFCVKCGLSLEGVTTLVTTGSAPTVDKKNPRKGQLSPRAKGILQGVAIVPGGIGAWFVLDIIYEGVFGAGMMGGLYAMVTLILLTALLRILYAVFLEEGSARRGRESALAYDRQAEVGAPVINPALPLPTNEIVQPLSVTEKTTRHLDVPR
jgi:hypothetical protein